MRDESDRPPPEGAPEPGEGESRAARRALEVRLEAQRRRRRLAAVLAPVLLVGAAAGVLWWQNGRGQAPASAGSAAVVAPRTCPDRTAVTVWVPPALRAPMVEAAAAYQSSSKAPCVSYVVKTRNPIESLIGLGPGQPERPDAWVPDAAAWVERVNAATGIDAKAAAPFAQSPLVVAMDPGRAAALTAPPRWPELLSPGSSLRLSDPRSTTAGMLALAAALPHLTTQQARAALPRLAGQTAPSTSELFSSYVARPSTAAAFPVSEADLIAHNRSEPAHPMVSVTPVGGLPAFEYALVNVSSDPDRAKAVDLLRTYLGGPDAAAVLARSGLRSSAAPAAMPTPPGSIGAVAVGPAPSPAAVTAATDAWQSATTDFSLLAVFDVSGSMRQRVEGSTRVAITQEAAGIALAALPRSTRLGVWVFSAGIGPGGADHREVAPMALLSDPAHRARVASAAARLSSQVGGGTGLYDTIWASFREARARYDPARVNAVVVLTDGRNEDPGGLTLARLEANLRAAEDPDRPVAITTIGIGPDVDSQALSRISRMSHSNYYAAPRPADITTVLAKALFDHECKNGRCV